MGKQEQEKENSQKTEREDGRRPCVAFRLDDVQDLYHNEIQMSIIDTFREENAKLTIGIISNSFGKDSMLLNRIKNSTRGKDNSVIRVASHGWDHIDMTKTKKEDQSLMIKLSKQKIYNLLGINPLVFIPPFDLFNKDTIVALQENGMPYLSSSVKHDPPPYGSQNSVPYHFPMTVSTGYVFFNKYWYDVSNAGIMTRIHKSIRKYGYAIILMHPQQYLQKKKSSNGHEIILQQKLTKLNDLIEGIRGIGLDIVSIEEMNQHV